MSGTLIDEPSVLRAWASAAAELYQPGVAPGFMAVTAGAGFAETVPAVRALDMLADEFGAERPGVVADVLLPRSTIRAVGTVADRMDAGWRLFGRGRRRGLRFSGWTNTYFERLTGHWRDRHLRLHVIKENRLRSIIEKINLWEKDVEAALFVNTDAAGDRLRPRGAPCLQYVQFRLHDSNQISLFALYRAHDYQHKALGNLLGLQRLGQFVGSETGRIFTRQTVFSIHPMAASGKQALRDFVDAVRETPGF